MSETDHPTEGTRPVRIRRAIVPAAGQGTRLLPATRAQAKEMLPLGTKPVIQMAAEELLAAGVRSVLIVTGWGKEAIKNHFDSANGPARSGGGEYESSGIFDPAAMQFFYTRQSVPRGLGDALLHGEDFVGSEDFVVALGDCAIVGGQTPSLVERLIAAHQIQGAAATLAVQRVSPEQTRRYGIIRVAEASGKLLRVGGIVEKPGPEQAPSNWAVTARYVFAPHLFGFLRQVPPGYGGEIQLTDAIQQMIESGLPVWAVPLTKQEIRLDVGNKSSYARAFVRTMLSDPETGAELREYVARLLDLLSGQSSADPDRWQE